MFVTLPFSMSLIVTWTVPTFMCFQQKMPAVVVVHGGAWAVPDDLAEASIEGAKLAALNGFSVLEGGGSALDAVEAAVKNMEDNVVFGAGKVSIKLKLTTIKNTPDFIGARWLHLLAAIPTFIQFILIIFQ